MAARLATTRFEHHERGDAAAPSTTWASRPRPPTRWSPPRPGSPRQTSSPGVDDTQCCYARKTETWLTGPDDARWEWYVKTGDSEQFANLVVSPIGGSCCAS